MVSNPGSQVIFAYIYMEWESKKYISFLPCSLLYSPRVALFAFIQETELGWNEMYQPSKCSCNIVTVPQLLELLYLFARIPLTSLTICDINTGFCGLHRDALRFNVRSLSHPNRDSGNNYQCCRCQPLTHMTALLRKVQRYFQAKTHTRATPYYIFIYMTIWSELLNVISDQRALQQHRLIKLCARKHSANQCRWWQAMRKLGYNGARTSSRCKRTRRR